MGQKVSKNMSNESELIEMLTAIRREIQPVSNDDNCTVVANCKPDSLRFVIDECLDYISRNGILIF